MENNACFVCQSKENILNIDSNILPWKTKLMQCIPELDWAIPCCMCLPCAAKLEELSAFRDNCVQSYKKHLNIHKTIDFNEAVILEIPIPDLIYFCKHCSSDFNDVKELEAHIKDVHIYGMDEAKTDEDEGKLKRYKASENMCEKCGKIYSSRANLNQHIALKHRNTEKNFECGNCNRKFRVKKYLMSHLRMKRTAYTCKYCQSSFCNSTQLEDHYVDVHQHIKINVDVKEDGTKLFKCSRCEKVFFRKSTLKVHFKTHNTELNYECKLCNRKFKLLSYLQQHERWHRGEPRRPLERAFACTKCPKTFRSAYEVPLHKLVAHTDPESWAYVCEDCDRKFPLLYRLKRHRQTVHLKSLTVADKLQFTSVCEFCGLKFMRNHDLQNHRNKHLGERRFGCDMCDSRFYSKAGLRRHKLRHAKLRFKCLNCDKIFVSENGLERHQKHEHDAADVELHSEVVYGNQQMLYSTAVYLLQQGDIIDADVDHQMK